jgi:hypothetical protein
MLPVRARAIMPAPLLLGAIAINITHAARVEASNAVRTRYRVAHGAYKAKILVEFIVVTGYLHMSSNRPGNTSPEVTI